MGKDSRKNPITQESWQINLLWALPDLLGHGEGGELYAE